MLGLILSFIVVIAICEFVGQVAGFAIFGVAGLFGVGPLTEEPQRKHVEPQSIAPMRLSPTATDDALEFLFRWLAEKGATGNAVRITFLVNFGDESLFLEQDEIRHGDAYFEWCGKTVLLIDLKTARKLAHFTFHVDDAGQKLILV